MGRRPHGGLVHVSPKRAECGGCVPGAPSVNVPALLLRRGQKGSRFFSAGHPGLEQTDQVRVAVCANRSSAELELPARPDAHGGDAALTRTRRVRGRGGVEWGRRSVYELGGGDPAAVGCIVWIAGRRRQDIRPGCASCVAARTWRLHITNGGDATGDSHIIRPELPHIHTARAGAGASSIIPGLKLRTRRGSARAWTSLPRITRRTLG